MTVIKDLPEGTVSRALNQAAVSPGFVSPVAFCVWLERVFETELVWLMRL